MMNLPATYRAAAHTGDQSKYVSGETHTSTLGMAEALVAAVVAQAPEVLAAIPLYAASQWQAGFGLLRSADQAVQALGLRLVLDALSCTPHAAMDLVIASRAVLAG